MPSEDDLLFAEHVVKAGFLTREEVDESLSVQQRMDEMGVRESLRNVLVKRGALREGDAAVVARNAGLRSGGEPIPGYTLEARLGTGAMGSVYKAWQKGMKRHVAIKILRRDLTDDPRQVERLQREAALVGRLDHPYIVRGLDSGETDGLVWFVMELVEGETLRERISRLSRIEPEEAVRITRQLAEALEHAATHGIVHRDIKPGNILIGGDGVPRLTDYGLAKGESDDALTQLDATLGTPQYIAPEQARNPRDADIRSDVYSLGATLYAMLTGHPPFAGETMAATLTKVLYERPRPLAEEAPGTPPALAYLVERMMAKDRRHRYQTPAELLRDLRALEAGRLTVPSGFKGDISEFVETRRHRRIWLTGAALVFGAALVAMGVREWERHGTESRRRGAAVEELARLRRIEGTPDSWDGDTVGKMRAAYERLTHDYAGSPAAEEAMSDLARWTTQETELRRANELALRADDPQDQWVRLVADVTQREAALHDVPDASVARRRLAALLADVRERRDRHAEPEIEKAKTAAAQLPLEQAGARFDALAAILAARFYGTEPSRLIDEANLLSARFRAAVTALDRHFADYEQSLGRAVPGERDHRALEALLQRSSREAREDGRLAALLEVLPPPGSRSSAVVLRTERLREELLKDASAAWDRVRRTADEARSQGDAASAAALLADFAERALDAERDKALALREQILGQVRQSAKFVTDSADEYAQRFFDALRRRDSAAARETLDDLAVLGRSSLLPANAAGEFVDAGRRLLELIDRYAWDALRARFDKGGALESGLSVRKGQGGIVGYRDVRDVRLVGRDLLFTYENGRTERCSIYDVALDDVIRYSGMTPTDPAQALVISAMRLAEFQSADPVDARRQLAEMGGTLEAARKDPSQQPLVARLAKLRQDLARKAEDDMRRAEEQAEESHREAKKALDQGRFENALRQFRSLLETRSFNRTEYVKRNRDEITRGRDEAAESLRSANYAARFPGALFTRAADGTAELLFDFESPDLAAAEARKMLGLVEGRTEVDSRPAAIANQPDLTAPKRIAVVPLVIEHVLAWRPGDSGGSPRSFPLTVDCPFEMRKRVEVSFLYRSDAPFFLAVSIGGATAGVLSAEESPYGGRGIEIWSAADLDRPDRSFDDHHRSGWLAKHPEALRKEGDRRFFAFEPGRTYRVRFVKDERKGSFFVDDQLRWEGDCHPTSGPLEGRIVLASYGPGEVDDLRIAGILDTEWLHGR